MSNKTYTDMLANRYGILKPIGSGEFGEVWLALDTQKDNMEVAIKQVLKAELDKVKKRMELFQTEKKIMQMIDNENVIKLLDHFETKEKHYLVMDYCNQGDLDSYIKSIKLKEKRLLTEDEAKEFMKQLLNGFRGLHELFVIHRDLKLKNILVHNGKLKIADFGLSKVGELGVTHVGTPYTKAPEVFKGRGRIRYTNKADIWSLGIIYYQLLFDLKYPFTGQSEQDLFNNIEKCREVDFQPKGIVVTISRNARNLITRMLQKDPTKRINWFELYKEPYLGLNQSEASGFDPIFEEVMTQFQLIRTLQSKILETLVNTEMLRTEHRTITNINTYYVQFMLAKRLVNLNFLLEKNITILQAKQSDFQLTTGFLSLVQEVEDTRIDYADYRKITLENLQQFILRRQAQKKPFESAIHDEIQNTRIEWPAYQQFLLNYYFCLMDLQEHLEPKNQTKVQPYYAMRTLQVLEHIVDLLKCLENDEEFQGVKLKQKSQSNDLEKLVEEEKEEFTTPTPTSQIHANIQEIQMKDISNVDNNLYTSTKERINLIRMNIQELYQMMFFE